MPLEPIVVHRQSRGIVVTIDKSARLRLSSGALRELKWLPYQLVVCSVDPEFKRIGLARQELAKVPIATPAKIDKRGYVYKLGKGIVDKLALNIADAPFTFEYVGPVDDGGTRWYAFDLAHPSS